MKIIAYRDMRKNILNHLKSYPPNDNTEGWIMGLEGRSESPALNSLIFGIVDTINDAITEDNESD